MTKWRKFYTHSRPFKSSIEADAPLYESLPPDPYVGQLAAVGNEIYVGVGGS